jgi:3-methyladenine DNA glycosylase AlkD
VRRAAFSLMAALAVHDKTAGDEDFRRLLPVILEAATDERNFVRKAVNWALRQIGKRNRNLNGLAVETALLMQAIDSRAARWIAADALRELRGATVQARLGSADFATRIVSEYARWRL